MKISKLVTGLLGIVAIVAATQTRAFGDTSLGGNYVISGASYQGTVSIKTAGNSIFKLRWAIPNSPSRGIGIRMNNTLGAGWADNNNTAGVAMYRINGGTLTGKWTDTNTPSGKFGTETLTGPADLNGTYTVSKSKLPGGGSYGGTVSIRPSGDFYTVKWTLKNHTVTGIGMRKANLLIVGYNEPGAKSNGVVAYDINGATLSGRFGTVGNNKMSVENLTKQ